MKPTEIANYEARIEAADDIDGWAQIDRELKNRADHDSIDVDRLRDKIEEHCCGLVMNTVLRTLATDQDGYDQEAFQELMENMPEVDEDDPEALLAAMAWKNARLAILLQQQPGRFQEFRRNMMRAGHEGIEFRISDMLADRDMEVALRETEMNGANIAAWCNAFLAATEHQGGERFMAHLDAALFAIEANDADQVTQIAEQIKEDLALGFIEEDDVDSLRAIGTYLQEYTTIQGWNANGDLALAIHAFVQRVKAQPNGLEDLRNISRNPYSPQSQALLQELLRQAYGPRQPRRGQQI